MLLSVWGGVRFKGLWGRESPPRPPPCTCVLVPLILSLSYCLRRARACRKEEKKLMYKNLVGTIAATTLVRAYSTQQGKRFFLFRHLFCRGSSVSLRLLFLPSPSLILLFT